MAVNPAPLEFAAEHAHNAVLGLLYAAFVDIRAASGRLDKLPPEDVELVNMISNMFHNVPAALGKVATGERSYQQVLDDLWWENGWRGGQDWLRLQMDNLGLAPEDLVTPRSDWTPSSW